MLLKKIAKFFFYYILGVFGILAVSVLPASFQHNGVYSFKEHFVTYIDFITFFFNPDNWVYNFKGRAEPVLDILWDPFVYTMQILVGGLALGLGLALLLAFITVLLPKFMYTFIKKTLDFLEAIPDLLIAILLQAFVVFIYKKFGFLPFGLASLGEDEKIYFAPILTLSILPLISMYKIILLMIEEEKLRDYVEFAKGKGIRDLRILIKHILKNIAPSIFYHSKIITWGTLSTLFIVEYIFNVRGITYYILEYFFPMNIAFSLLILFTPFYLFYTLVDLWLEKEASSGKPIYHKRAKIANEQKSITLPRLRIPVKTWVISLVMFLWDSIKAFVTHMKNPKFAIGFLVLIGIYLYSVGVELFQEDPVATQRFQYNESGTIVAGPPFPPGEVFALGSDRFGNSLYDQIIVGAKYTLWYGFLIAFLRVFIGFVLGIFFALKLRPSIQKAMEKLVDSTHFLPLSLIAYILLKPILIINPDGPSAYSYDERIWIEVAILTLLVIPLTMVLAGNEMKEVMKRDFITSARILGGGTGHLLRKHILPHIGARMTILFGQQFIQVLLIFIHLGFFQLFLGGSIIQMIANKPLDSVTQEWSGLLGVNKDALVTGKYWLFITVLIAFMIVIYAMQFIIQGVKEVQQVKVGVLYKKPKKKRWKQKQNHSKTISKTPDRFVFQHPSLQKANVINSEGSDK